MRGEITTRGVMIAIPLLKNNTNHFGSLGTKVENGNPFLLTLVTSFHTRYKFVAFCFFFPFSLTVFHRGRQQKSGGRQ